MAAVGRHTAAALGAVFIYTAVLEGLVRGFRPQWTPWLLGDNIVAFISWQATTFQLDLDPSSCRPAGRSS